MPMINQPAPQFSAQAIFDGGEVRDISLADYKGKWAVLIFYPLDFTFVCPTELTQFRELLSQFKIANAEVMACSVDSVHSHKRWLRDDLGNLGFPLIADLTKKIAKDYGILIEDRGIATRGTFIIDPNQNIQYMGIHNTSVGRDGREILRVLQACQSGQLCQAGWKKGDSHVTPLK
jgi:peroxiredoxin (alkyl hydroperoxide reductase subunit C)